MDFTYENSPSSNVISKSYTTPEVAINLESNEAPLHTRYNTRSSMAENVTTPRYNTRSTMNTNKRQYYGDKTPRYNVQRGTSRKQRRRKKSNIKSRNAAISCHKHTVDVQKVKYDFKQLSPHDQRLFMEEMVTEVNLKEILPLRDYVPDKELKIYNIEQYFVQIDPIEGDYVTQAAEM